MTQKEAFIASIFIKLTKSAANDQDLKFSKITRNN